MNPFKSVCYQRPLRMIVMMLFISLLISNSLQGRDYRVKSPDQRMTVTVTTGDKLYYTVTFDGKKIIKPSPISLKIEPGIVLGRNPKVTSSRSRSVNQTLTPVVREKNATIRDRFNQLSLSFKGRYGLIFRVYNDAAAYRFVLDLKNRKTVTIVNEEVVFTFAGDPCIYFPAETSFMSHQERLYQYVRLKNLTAGTFCSLPALVDIKEGPKIALLEADLEDYPGMYLRGNSNSTLSGIFPGVALKEAQVDLSRRGGDRNIRVLVYAPYIAVTRAKRRLPWRVLVVARKDADLLNCQVVYKLAAPLKLKDTTWIKPGKVAWDWWNDNNVYGVDFKAGLNTETYKYYIDFAAKYGIEYIILDEGWYKLGDLSAINPDIDMEALLAHAQEKQVGIILWVVWKTLEDQLQEAMQQFERWGVKGIKVDFMQRDDQWMVKYYHRIAAEAAKRKLLVDFHGSYTPRGLRRAFPNVLTREGVKGLEHYKWKSGLDAEHEVTLPFIRMLAGPMDFTPGAMINAQEKSFAPFWHCPMSRGTRCRQLAMYVIYESPLQMLADSPSNYLREKECMEFLAPVPTVWDETRVLEAKLGDYIAIARRNGREWYVGAMTDNSPRQMELVFDFLGPGNYRADIFSDGVNAHRNGIDFQRQARNLSNGQKITIRLAPAGGWAARIVPADAQTD